MIDRAEDQVARPRRTQLLLVVEDNPGDARLLREMLREYAGGEFEVTHVESLADAEEFLADGQVDLIVLDLGLPDAQGLEVVRRTRVAAPRIPLVVLTGLDDESLAVQALQEGAQDYLIKGDIEARGLRRALRYAVERMVLEEARRAGESQLLQAQKLESVGRLAGGIAHDFNNMLFAISGYAELLTQDLASMTADGADMSSLVESVSAISDAARRASALTRQLLAFSRQQMVVVESLDLNEAVDAIAPLARQLIGTSLQLTLKLDPAAGHIRADPSQVEQIIVNLVVNARDAMAGGGTVAIETGVALSGDPDLSGMDTQAQEFVFLVVHDTGVGMDQETKGHIFEPFFTTKDLGKGTGLGLATAHAIVKNAGGRIAVQSEPGQGSTFKLFFPRVDAMVADLPPAPVLTLAGSGRIMVVEDDVAVRDMVVRLLGRAGYDVQIALGGSDALDKAQVAPPEVVVTDIVMPDMSGVELAETLMALYPSTRLVLLSGYAPDQMDLGRVTAKGATFVLKPVSSASLIHAVQTAIASARSNDAGQ